VSATTWTPGAVASESFAAALEIWRAVEAQHVVSTMRIADSPEDQRRLESILDAAKPPMRKDVEGLHYLLAAPFRYRPDPPGSRFRAPEDPGVYYGSGEIRTACAEMAWWRWKGFLLDARELPELPPVAFSIFPVDVKGRAVDLRKPAFAAGHRTWTHRSSYGGTQRFGRAARAAGIAIILYESVRDPERGTNAAIMTPAAFRRFDETRKQTWTLLLSRERAAWIRDGSTAFSFRY
jgi:hypothetical protein